jgi:hypothetical protein
MRDSTPQKPPNNERYALLTQQTALWTQIRDWRREAGMRVDPSPESLIEWRARTVKEAQRVCPDTHPITKTCEDICSLAEAICDIADKLGRDDHQAQEKCTSAKASCKEAKQRCCTKCSEERPNK